MNRISQRYNKCMVSLGFPGEFPIDIVSSHDFINWYKVNLKM